MLSKKLKGKKMNQYFETYGKGEALILLHGNGEDLTYFKRQIPVFAKYFRVYAIDMRGHGKTPRGSGRFSIKRFAEDLYLFMLQHKIKRAHILGFSDGANVAMYFALSHPERVKSLILNGGNLTPAGVKRRYQLPIEMSYAFLKRVAKNKRNLRKKAELLALMVNEPHIRVSEIKKITVPALVIAGTKDMIKETHTRLIAKALPNSKLKIISGDHFIAAKNSALFNQTVLEFLENISEESY